MNTLLNVARSCVIFVGTSGFLFGQIFFGRFSLVRTIIGVSGIVAGALSWPAVKSSGLKFLVAVSCIAGLLGVAMDAYRYYARTVSPGGYYPWILVGPFVACLLLIACYEFQSTE